MNAAEFYRTLKAHIEEAVQSKAPYKAKVTGVSGNLVQIQTYDATAPLGEWLSRLDGVALVVNDEVVVVDIGGKPFVLGKVKK